MPFLSPNQQHQSAEGYSKKGKKADMTPDKLLLHPQHFIVTNYQFLIITGSTDKNLATYM